MALAIDAVSPLIVEANAPSLTTATFTAPANSKLVAFTSMNSTGGATTTTVTSTGSLTWTLRKRQNVQDGTAEIWTTDNTTSQSITVTSTQSVTTQGHLVVMVFTGSETGFTGVTAGASNSSGLPTTGSMTTLTVGSYVLAVASDWTAGGLGTYGTGQTNIDEFHTAAQYTSHVWRTTAVLTGTTQTMNLTAPAAQNYNIAAIEIKEAAGAATGRPPVRRQPPAAVHRAATL